MDDADEAAAVSADDAQPSRVDAFDAALERVARSGSRGDAPTGVLLTGETGSGKTRAARRLHDLSDRADGPFVVAHLAGLTPTLLEGELFGHVEGAFTGASGARRGRFQRADGGTIVLEAVETLALPLQVKLLRVLQERVVEPVGAETVVPVDARVVATTSLDLTRAVEEGEFREDLYYRLAVVLLDVPPLRVRARSRPGGFSRICMDSLQAVAKRCGVPPRPLSPDAVERLAEHPWPGNFRELENALERVLVLAPEGADAIEPKEFAFLDEAVAGRADELARAALAHGVGAADLERAMIDAALEEERGNVAAAARRLGLTRRAFDYRRKRL